MAEVPRSLSIATASALVSSRECGRNEVLQAVKDATNVCEQDKLMRFGARHVVSENARVLM
jgi:hypothetical protein